MSGKASDHMADLRISGGGFLKAQGVMQSEGSSIIGKDVYLNLPVAALPEQRKKKSQGSGGNSAAPHCRSNGNAIGDCIAAGGMQGNAAGMPAVCTDEKTVRINGDEFDVHNCPFPGRGLTRLFGNDIIRKASWAYNKGEITWKK